MNVRIRPDLEKLIQEDVERGPYGSVDEYVEEAVSLLHQQEQWLAQNRAEIKAKIEEGYAQAKRGQLLEADEVRQATRDRIQGLSKTGER